MNEGGIDTIADPMNLAISAAWHACPTRANDVKALQVFECRAMVRAAVLGYLQALAQETYSNE